MGRAGLTASLEEIGHGEKRGRCAEEAAVGGGVAYCVDRAKNPSVMERSEMAAAQG